MKRLFYRFSIAAAFSALIVWSVVNNPVGASKGTERQDKISKDCTYKGFKLYGKVKFVEHFPDIKVQIVNAFPDLKVKMVNAFPDKCGEWQIVEHFPDLKVQIVEHFPDIKIQLVENFPGLP